MIDVTGSHDSDVRRIIQNMLECIVRLGVQDSCTLDEFKGLLVHAVLAARLAKVDERDPTGTNRTLQSA